YVQRQSLLPRDRDASRPPADRHGVQDAEPHVPGLLRSHTRQRTAADRTRDPVGSPLWYPREQEGRSSRATSASLARRGMKMLLGGSVRSGPNVWFIRDRGLVWENADGLGRFWRWASSPCFSFGRPCDLPGLSVRARIGLCRFSRWFSHLSVSTI